MFQNIQSVFNKTHLLECLIEEKPDLDVICISETWLNSEKIKLLQFKDYTICSPFCRKEHEGGGVCVVLKNTLEYHERLDINILSLEMVFEISAIELPKENLLIINLYWPNSKREIEVFYNCLENLLKLISTRDFSKNIVIGGDFNVDFLKNSNERHRLSNIMLLYNFRQKITEPTRVTSTSSKCIDLLFTNFNTRHSKLTVEEFGLSDHRGILLSIPRSTQRLQQLSMYKRIYNEANIKKI